MEERAPGEVELSVVVPSYNERENLSPLLARLKEALDTRQVSYEVIITDDGSTDGSWETLLELARTHPFLRAQRFERNCGQTAALEAGLRAARGRVLVTLDGDLQNDPRDLGLLLEALEGCDCASGSRVESRRRGDPFLKVISSRIANRVRNAVTGVDFSDSACNFRAMRRECLERIKFFNGAHRFLSTLIKMEGFRVVEVPISCGRRLHGKSKYGLWNRLFRASRDLLGVRWMMSRSYRYVITEKSDGQRR
jgi:dolichol-phosphate mannosyltransferase